MGQNDVDGRIRQAELAGGKLFRCIRRAGKCHGEGVTRDWYGNVVKQYAAKLDLTGLAPHDLRQNVPQHICSISAANSGFVER
jgi:hypothetical protein